jgi:hypothetical protein
VNGCSNKKSPNSSHVSNKSKGLLIVMTVLLLETLHHKMSLLILNRAIGASLDLVHPLAGDGSDIRRQRLEQDPKCQYALQKKFPQPCMLPLMVSGSLPIGRGLSQNSSSEAKAIGRTNGATVIESMARRRLRWRSNDGLGRVRRWCRSRPTSVVVSYLTRRTHRWWRRRYWWGEGGGGVVGDKREAEGGSGGVLMRDRKEFGGGA